MGSVVWSLSNRDARTTKGVRRNPRRGVAFLGIDVRDNNREAAVDFIVDRKVTFPSIYDPPMRTMIALGARYPTTAIPSTIVLDRSHRVAAVFLRALLAEDLEPVVRRLAAETATGSGPPR